MSRSSLTQSNLKEANKTGLYHKMEVYSATPITSVDGVKHVYDCHDMIFELAASLLPEAQDIEFVALLPAEKPGVLTEMRPNCTGKFTESPNMAEHESVKNFICHTISFAYMYSSAKSNQINCGPR